MLRLDLATTQLEPLLARLLAPRVEGVCCRIARDEGGNESLSVLLQRVDSGAFVLGRALPRLDVELELRGRLLLDGRVELGWKVVRIAPLPAFVARALPLDGFVRRALLEQVAAAGLSEAVELGPSSLALDLGRVALGPLGEGWLACTSLRLPDGERALHAELALQPPAGADA